MSQLHLCPKNVFIIKQKRNFVYGHGQDVFGFIKHADADKVSKFIQKYKSKICHYRTVIPHRYDIVKIEAHEIDCIVEVYTQDMYAKTILANNMSIRIISNTNNSIKEMISLESFLKIDAIIENKGFLENTFLK